jgi:hypothetical protein
MVVSRLSALLKAIGYLGELNFIGSVLSIFTARFPPFAYSALRRKIAICTFTHLV